MLKGTRKQAAVQLFQSGFSFKEVARLLGVTVGEVMNAVRKALR